MTTRRRVRMRLRLLLGAVAAVALLVGGWLWVRDSSLVAVMAEGRRRVQERFGVALEPEVQVLGPVDLPAEWTGR